MDGTAELSKKGGRCGGTHDTHITMDATAERQGGSMVNATQYDYDLLFYDRYYPEHADSALNVRLRWLNTDRKFFTIVCEYFNPAIEYYRQIMYDI